MAWKDKIKDAKETVTSKVAGNSDKIESGLTKAAGFVDDKTGGKWHDKIETGVDKAKGALPRNDDGSPESPGGPGGDTPPA